MRRPRTLLLTIRGLGQMLSFQCASVLAMTFAGLDLLKRISQLNDGVRTPTLSATDAIIGNRLHGVLVIFNRWNKLTDFRFRSVPESAAGRIQSFLHAAAFAAFAKRHPPFDFMQGRGRSLRYSCLNQRHPPTPVRVLVGRIRRRIGLLPASATSF